MSRRLWNQLEEGLKNEASAAAAESAALPPAAPVLPAPPDSASALPASPAPAPRAPLALTPKETLEQPPAGAPESLPAKKMDLDSITPRRTPAPSQDTQAASLPAAPTGEFNTQWVSRTDPDAATTFRRGKGVTLGYRDHTLVDNQCGVILATVVTSADYDDAELLPVLLNQAEKYAQVRPREAVADSQYGSEKNQLRLQRRGIDDYLKRRVGKKSGSSWLDLLDPALPKGRAIHLMKRRMHVAEGRFAMAHSRMNHRRCRWRRRYRVQTQAYLVAMAQNMHKLARHGVRPPRNRANRALSTPAALQNLRPPAPYRRPCRHCRH
jgi:IS5 family transposase